VILVADALDQFIAEVGVSPTANADAKRTSLNRFLGLRMRLENHADMSYLVQKDQVNNVGLRVTLKDYLSIDVAKFQSGYWSKYMRGLAVQRGFR